MIGKNQKRKGKTGIINYATPIFDKVDFVVLR